ncbi:DUF6452 family protein [Fulvivirga ligni]|uniref:DUF6452 family protein n=1 Tax=Fulvivirga ligni TaxID=2904246 RepID=UPI001F2A3E14|nr:DUF6452 family protein [Fulvivirga ligni]UII21940.1 DUF6452 family protein [Fulvivirga ligni]
MKYRLIYIVCACAALFTACLDDADCNSEASTNVTIGFFNSENASDTIRVSSLRALGIEDTVFYAPDLYSSLTIPLRTDRDSSVFSFITTYGPSTLTFKYHVGTRLVSEDCGLETVISNLSVKSTGVDSVKVINNILSNASTGNDVKVFN